MMVNFLRLSVLIGIFIGTSSADEHLYYRDGTRAYTCSPGKLTAGVQTKFTITTSTTLTEDINLVLYQLPETPTPGIDTDAIAWRIIPVQGSGGGAIVEVPFDVSIQASIVTDQGDIQLSNMVPAANGQVFAITMGNQGAINLQVDGTDTAGEAGLDIIKVNNKYDSGGKPPTIKVACFKNGKKLVELDAHFSGSNVQFKIYPILYAAWSTDLKEGETFKAGVFANTAEPMYFINPINKAQPGANVDVTLSLGTDSALHWAYTVDGYPPLPVPGLQLSANLPVPKVLTCTARCAAMQVMANAMMWAMTCRTDKNCWIQKVSVVFTNCLHECTKPTSLGLAATAGCARQGCPTKVPEFVCDLKKWPNVCLNAANGIKNGHPSCLIRDPTQSAKIARRKAACDNLKKHTYPPKGMTRPTCEEYPFASTLDGGYGAQVMWVEETENAAQGAALSDFYQNEDVMKKGDCFVLTVKW